MDSDFLVGLGVLAVSLVGSVLFGCIQFRWSGAGAPPAEGGCHACGASELVEVHPDAFRCAACGSDQGPGWARRQEEAALAALLALSPAEAGARARRGVDEAALLLAASLPALADPLQADPLRDGPERFEPHPELLDALGGAQEALALLREACMIDPEVAAALAPFDPAERFPELGDRHAPSELAAAAARVHGRAEVWLACIDAARRRPSPET